MVGFPLLWCDRTVYGQKRTSAQDPFAGLDSPINAGSHTIHLEIEEAMNSCVSLAFNFSADFK